MKELKQALESEIDTRKYKILYEECRELNNGGYSQFDRDYALRAAKDELIDDLHSVFKDENVILIFENLIESIR